MSNKYDLIVFDLDGTLLSSIEDIATSYRQACSEYGFPEPPTKEVTLWVGQGHSVAVENCFLWLKRELKKFGVTKFNCLSDKDLLNLTKDNIFSQYILPQQKSFESRHKELYLKVGNSRSILFPGVIKTLERLKASGVKLTVLTNKLKALTPICLSDMKIAHFFDKTFSDGDLQNNKPDPEGIIKFMEYFNISNKSRVLMVGDSINDIRAGKSAGVDTLGLTYGYNYNIHISDANPTYSNYHFCAVAAVNEGIDLNSQKFKILIDQMEN